MRFNLTFGVYVVLFRVIEVRIEVSDVPKDC